ncbi:MULTISPECIES: hypothetical protein [unclassified Streptomyces]|uniref:hypothetical protein n=1 Tax=unclassified Streptomyces TaxID=2593676 RepID=UPI00166176DB|nr:MULTISPECIES: hypothetical protein [unclassified Streptomyces]MBD0708990.1 hypothetical protein [Streptomyces sp. CBMA291]MBD0716669.1 hypothetical protein [Streptomyces sp. CBMA370]
MRSHGPVTVYDVARALPGIEELRDHSRGLAMLDAVLSPEWEGRYYSYDAHWSPAEQLASMRDGEGGEYTIVLSPAGAFARVFDHESPLSPYGPLADGATWPGVLDGVPEAFREYLTEPAFTDEDDVHVTTACLWRETGDTAWRTGPVDFTDVEDHPDPDGSARFLHLLVDRTPEAYATWAADFYECPVDLEAVRHVLALRPLTAETVAALNPETTLTALAEDIAEIGYPTA